MTTKNIFVSQSSDDFFVEFDGVNWKDISLTGSSLYFGNKDANEYKRGCGVRFLDVLIPKYSIINFSYLQMTCQTAQAGNDCKVKITGELLDNGTFSTLANTQTRRGVIMGGADDSYITTNQVSWTVPEFVLDTVYDSPDISVILQEIVNASAIKNIIFYIDDFDNLSTLGARRNIYSYAAAEEKRVHLIVNFTPPYKVWTGITRDLLNSNKI